jgi:uncharacterized protein (DUF736 family)
MIIGNFTFIDEGYSGLILAPGGFINPVRITPVAGKGVDNTSTVDGGVVDLGVAWKRHSGKTGKAYLSVRLDSPFLSAPINCALIEQDRGRIRAGLELQARRDGRDRVDGDERRRGDLPAAFCLSAGPSGPFGIESLQLVRRPSSLLSRKCHESLGFALASLKTTLF